MAKEIFVLCDGTGDSPEATDRSRTNVQVLREMLGIGFKGTRAETISGYEGWEVDKYDLPDGTARIVYYDRGLGAPAANKTDTAWWNPKIIYDLAASGYNYLRSADAQLTAKGIRENLKQSYKFLAKNYTPGDKVYLFGYSRGAYTQRLLITLIRYIGLLDTSKIKTDAELDAAIQYGFNIYDANIHPDYNPNAIAFRKNCHPTKNLVHFLGLWDTVRGFVVESVRQDAKLSSVVKNARHALSIDEERKIFKPELWIASEKTNSEQRWFSGVHSDVGGGYKERDLANIPLHWMVNEAIKFGLKVDPVSLQIFPKNPLAPQHDSLNAKIAGNGTWKQLNGNYRRPVMQTSASESVDDSVIMRYGKTVERLNGDQSDKITYRPPILTHELIAYANFKKVQPDKIAALKIPDADELEDVGESTSLLPKACFALK